VVGLRVAVDLDRDDAPGIRVQQARRAVQPILVVLVLLLEMLGAEEQSFAP
jgi:hypothetical protein